MVALPVPVLLMLTGNGLLVPTVTLLKFRLVGLGANCPTAVAALAESGIASGELDAVPDTAS